jgi:hypothetical protein
MIDGRLIDIVSKNLSEICWEKTEAKLEKMIKDAYIKGFKDGVSKAADVCGRCNGIDDSKNISDVCKSCKRNKVVIGNE